MEMDMKKALAVMMCAWMLGSSAAFALDNGIDFEITTDFFSKYVWRGQVLTDDPVWQPGISMAYGGFTAGIWANMDLDGTFSGDFTEVDYYLDYSGSLTETIGYSVGYIYYNFPEVLTSGGDTQEVYAGLSLDTFLSPSVTFYYDFDAVEGCYVAFGAGHSIDDFFNISEDLPVGLDISVNVGYADSDYNAAYWSVADSGFNDLTLSIGFPMELMGWSVTPSLNYMTLLDGDIRTQAASDGKDNEVFFTGISLGTSF